MTDKKKGRFEVIEDSKKKQKYLEEAAVIHAKGLLWNPGNPEMAISSQLSFLQKDRFGVEETPDSDSKAQFGKRVEINSRQIFGTLNLPRAVLFFNTTVREKSKSAYVLDVPPKLFKMQRRVFSRLVFPEGHENYIRYEEDGLPKQKKMYDLSETGLSFLISQAGATRLRIGQLLQISFKLKTNSFSISTEVRSIGPRRSSSSSSPTPQTKLESFAWYKVGVEFLALDRRESDLIAAFVFEENRRQLFQ